jgi:FkbM family methyltransferase
MPNTLMNIAAWMAARLPLSAKRALYQMGPFSRMVRNALNRAAPSGLSTIEVAGGELAGYRLSLDLQSEKDYWLGTYEPDLQTVIAELVRPGMVAYDVGANIGYISLLLAKAVGEMGHVYAFEALPDNLERLRTNLGLNSFLGDVEVVDAAVVDANRLVKFLVGPSGGMGKVDGSAGRDEFTYPTTLEVRGLSLDHFVFDLGKPIPRVIKMDIEGGEVLAFPGMLRLLTEAPPLLLIELHGEQAAKTAWQMLSGAGYRICVMAKGYALITSFEALNWKAYIVGFPPGWE